MSKENIDFSERSPSLRIEGPAAWINLNRPQQHNRFSPADIAAMLGILRDLAVRPNLRVLVITGRGPSFSSGFDLETLSGAHAAEGTAAFAELCDLVESMPMPTVCGLNGNVYGGATDFALACDFRLGVEGCQLMMSPGRLGVEYYYSGLRRYVERLGLSEAKRIFLSGEQIDTQTLLRIGFLNEVVAADALPARLASLASALAQRSQNSLRGLKASLNAIASGTGKIADINARFFASLGSSDAREGLQAHAERRPARFADV